MRSIRKAVFGVGLAVALVIGVADAASAHSHGGQLEKVKDSLHRFHSVEYAQRDHGFGLVTDVNGVSCIDDPAGTGDMGYHYANPDLVGDGKIDRFHPEAVLYERRNHGLRPDRDRVHRGAPPEQWTGTQASGSSSVRSSCSSTRRTASACPPSTCCTSGCGRRIHLGLFNPYKPRVSIAHRPRRLRYSAAVRRR